tara:strand:+ start:3552 stop:3926 length:375 start_codon:yes stop_codon:yes gene_type:complete
MPRPKKKQIKLEKESLLSLFQEIYNELVEQRNTAIRIQNKMLGFMKDADDLTLLGPVIKEQQKIIDSTIEKKLQLSKLQSTLVMKGSSTGPSDSATLSLDDREMLNTLINKNNNEEGESKNYNM